MKRLMIIDDEKYIRDTIRSIIMEMDTEFKNIDESSNAHEALDKMKSTKYDLVITDIKMPGIDGMEFIQKIQEYNEKPEIIILSGFTDFEYAQRAIRYEVKAYIVKPVEKKELIATIKSLEESMSHKENIAYKYKKYSSYINAININELNYILLKENISSDEILNILDNIEFPKFTKEFYVININSCFIEGYISDSKAADSLIEGSVNKFLDKTSITAIKFFDTFNNIVMITEEEIDMDLMLEELSINEFCKYSIGVSQKHKDLAEIKMAYNEAKYSLKYRIMSSQNKMIIRFSDVNSIKSKYEIPIDIIKSVASLIGKDKENSLRGFLSKIFDLRIITKSDIEYLEKVQAEMSKNILDKFKKKVYSGSIIPSEQYEALYNIYNYSSIRKYVSAFKDCLLNINEFILAESQLYKDSDPISLAISYIHGNYSRDLSLAIVANQVSLNYTYFSEIFKKKVGVNFVDYLKRIRVEKAKELLKLTNCKISEISQKVGYQSPKYFAADFSAITGCSPTEYRRSVQ